jgi:hypothetical protein
LYKPIYRTGKHHYIPSYDSLFPFSISQLYIAMDVGNPIPKAPIEDSSYQRFVGKNGMVYYSTEMVYYWDLLGLPP